MAINKRRRKLAENKIRSRRLMASAEISRLQARDAVCHASSSQHIIEANYDELSLTSLC